MFKTHPLLLRILFNSALGIVLIFLWTKFVNLETTVQILKGVQVQYGLIFILFFALSGTLRAFRLKLLLKNYHIPFKDIVMLNFVSQFLSFFIPIRAGEIAKSVYFTSQFSLPLGKTITWVFIDRTLDFTCMLALLVIFLPITITNLPSNFVYLIMIILIIFILFLTISVKNENFLKKITVFLSSFLVVGTIKKWFVSFTHTIIEGAGILRRHPLEIIPLILLTIVALAFDSFAWILIFTSFNFSININQSVLGNSLLAFTFLIPSAPGYVGSAEAAGLAIFSGILGLGNNLVSAGTVLFHILTAVAILILGTTSLYFLKFDLNLVWKKIRKES